MFIYRFLIAPLLIIMTILLALFGHKKTRKGLKLRSKSNSLTANSKDKIWIHASSGEFEYAKSLINSIKKSHKNIEILVTYFSPSYVKSIKNYPGVDLCIPLPLDTPSACHSFLTKYKPQLLLIARTDVWPEMLHQCHAKKIPSLLFSATGKKHNPLSLFYRKFLFKKLSAVYCVSEEDSNLIKKYFKGPIKAIGDTRYDQVFKRLDTPCTLNFDFSCNDPIVTLGSTWPEDEKKLLPTLSAQLKNYKIIIAPHEPTEAHLTSLKQQLSDNNISFQLYSQTGQWQSEVLIIDQLGLLADIYRFSDVAFVGGSFKSKVHSVMEPIGAGNLVFLGPKNKNNREAQVFKNKKDSSNQTIVTQVQSPDEIQQYLSNLTINTDAKNSIKAHFDQQLGATKELIADIFN